MVSQHWSVSDLSQTILYGIGLPPAHILSLRPLETRWKEAPHWASQKYHQTILNTPVAKGKVAPN